MQRSSFWIHSVSLANFEKKYKGIEVLGDGSNSSDGSREREDGVDWTIKRGWYVKECSCWDSKEKI